jgi:hypothetical protein
MGFEFWVGQLLMLKHYAVFKGLPTFKRLATLKKKSVKIRVIRGQNTMQHIARIWWKPV